MSRIVKLNNVDHHDLKVDARHGATSGDAVNQMLILPTEFEEAQREYPIFFRRDPSGALQPVALLGLDRDENLFLGENGWQARYVPAMQRRGPFSIGLVRGQEDVPPVIQVDLDHPWIASGEGAPLFLPHGGNTPYLEQMAGLLGLIYQGLSAIQPMFAAFEEAGLIEPVKVEIALNDTKRYTLLDLHSIEEAKLAALDGAALERLHRAGFLRAAFNAVASLSNVRRLIELKNRKSAAGVTA